MTQQGVAAGVPYVAVPAAGKDAPVVVAWHLLDEPSTEQRLAAAVPLDGLDAWKFYLGLPMSSSRQPDDILERRNADPVQNVHGPIAMGAVAEFPAAFAELRERFGFAADAPLGVLGGSLGGAVAQLAIADGGLDIRAAVLVNPVARLRPLIDTFSARFGSPYRWTPPADAIADRLDFAARADELTGVAIRYVTGADDDPDAILNPVGEVVAALHERQAQVDRQVVADMGHAIDKNEVDRLAVDWFSKHLS